jgi:hypothetical protein
VFQEGMVEAEVTRKRVVTSQSLSALTEQDGSLQEGLSRD